MYSWPRDQGQSPQCLESPNLVPPHHTRLHFFSTFDRRANRSTDGTYLHLILVEIALSLYVKNFRVKEVTPGNQDNKHSKVSELAGKWTFFPGLTCYT
ncbi:hypothetical protein RRG08_002777 [Elysia crispata]|uniref:Uncharacterized protein n=1 Tax=Elysia crispata TaxID=231223 RepID=A0AAE0XVB7_9GAST|nr:hypothetical protein RRG08_002777 [Elysia crispata]